MLTGLQIAMLIVLNLVSGLTIGFFWGYIKGGMDEAENYEEEIKELEEELEELRND
jgi:Tfp pilus assembly protein PilO